MAVLRGTQVAVRAVQAAKERTNHFDTRAVDEKAGETFIARFRGWVAGDIDPVGISNVEDYLYTLPMPDLCSAVSRLRGPTDKVFDTVVPNAAYDENAQRDELYMEALGLLTNPKVYRVALCETYEGAWSQYNDDELWSHCYDMQVTMTRDLDKFGREEMTKALAQRMLQEEPGVVARHYLAGNKGRTGSPLFLNCGDSETAVLGDIKSGSSCRLCVSRVAGGKSSPVGWPTTTYFLSVFDYRKRHRVAGAAGGKTQYIPCTIDETGYCPHCAHNQMIDATPQDEMVLDRLKQLTDTAGYRRVYVEGSRLFRLAQKFYALVEAMTLRIAGICRSCGSGKIKVTGATCPSCGGLHNWNEIHRQGWTALSDSAIGCAHCNVHAKPTLIRECSNGCEEPLPGRLMDADIACTMTGEKKAKNWSFVEQLPLRMLDPNDPADLKVLSAPLANIEQECRAPNPDEQCRAIGLAVDPLTNEPVQGAPVPIQHGQPGGRPPGAPGSAPPGVPGYRPTGAPPMPGAVTQQGPAPHAPVAQPHAARPVAPPARPGAPVARPAAAPVAFAAVMPQQKRAAKPLFGGKR